MPDLRVRLVFNPRAGAGTASRRLHELVDAMHKADLSFEIVRTSGPGDATRIARSSFDDGVDLLGVVGGDGTLNEVVQAYIDKEGNPLAGPEIAIIPLGTGGDTRRTLGLSGDLHQAVSRLQHGSARAYDLAVINLVDFENKNAVKAFVNITSFGIGGVTDKLVNDMPKWLGGKASFLIGSARALLQYKNAHVHVEVDGKPFHRGPVFNVVVANGRYFGGGMMVAPEANPSDGLLDIVALGDLTKREVLALSQRIYNGTHISLPKVHSVRGMRLEAKSESKRQPVLLDMDGETPGKLPISIHVLPSAIRFRS